MYLSTEHVPGMIYHEIIIPFPVDKYILIQVVKIWLCIYIVGLQARPNAVVGSPDYAVQMLHAQLFNVNTTCHNIPLGVSDSSVTQWYCVLSAAHLANRTAGHSNTDSFQVHYWQLNCPRISAF